MDAEHWQAIWRQRSSLAWLLWPLSWLYRTLLGWQRWRFRLGWRRVQRAPVPVLVVGNVVVGGTGKTPTVAALVQHLRQRGWTPGLVSRGHGGRDAGPARPVTVDDPAEAVGDEPALLVRLCQAPMVVGRDRAQAIARLLQLHPQVDVVVSDDGMQHWAMARDLTVVVFDDRGVGNGWCLPAGLLREPWPAPPWGGSAMLVLHTGDPAHAPPSPYPVYQAWRQLAAEACNAQGLRRPLADPSAWAQRPLAGVAAIGRPHAFFDMLSAQGLRLSRRMPLADHADGSTLLQALDATHTWLCTDKDAVKLFPLLAQRPDLDVWRVALAQSPEPAFFDAIDRALEGLSSRHGRQTA